VLGASLAAQNLSAPPWVRQGGVVNAASRLPVNLPGGVLAPGALVEIEGLRFDPADIAVEIESGGRAHSATIVRATPETITAILPKLKQPGPARLFVVSHGKRSVGSDITIGSGAFGIFTANGKGWGAAASPAWTGATVTLTGTGLGDAGERSIEVFVGGRKASHVRVGERKNGIEHLGFEVPAATAPGCSVPVAVKVGAAVSNFAVLPVGGQSGCNGASLKTPWYERLSALGERSATVVLLRSDVVLELAAGKPVPFMLDNLSAAFAKRVRERDSSPLDLIPPAGACLTWAGPIDANHLVLPTFIGPTPDSPDAGLDLGEDIAEQTSSLEDLDAGPFLSVTGPEGTRSARRSAHKPRMYSAILGGNPPLTRIPPKPLFLTPGAYQIAIQGGADVDAAAATLDFPGPILWRNRDSTSMLDRSLGARVEWTLPAGYRAVVIASNIDRRNSLAGVAVCMPAADAKEFRIPPMAVANLPATTVSSSDLSLGFMGVAAIPMEAPVFRAKGLDHGRLVGASLSGRSVVIR
jgi:uncharacterized protein (TIGR03437 family)